ncbi:MAG TPA: SLATT domain-containing protein [Longimicrobium sp.]|nr:SLATT domain-containing protein [Longimicrobium sp.]
MKSSEPQSYLEPGALGDLSWAAADVETSLAAVYSHVMKDADEALGWYQRNRVPKKRGGLSIRVMAVLLIAAAGLLPLVIQLADPLLRDGQGNELVRINPLWSSFFVGLAAALVAYDRYFGLSSGWIRYVSTALSIRTAMEAFEMEWACQRATLAGAAPNAAQLEQMLAKCKEFANRLNSIVGDETNTWVQEFQASLKEVDNAVRAAQDEAKQRKQSSVPGALNLTLANRASVKGKWKVQVDDADPQEYSGNSAALAPLEPGLRLIRVFGTVGDEARAEEKTVTITPGSIGSESFTL